MGREVWWATVHGFAKTESLALHLVIILEFRKIYSSQKEEQREAKGKGEKERYTHLSAELHQQHTLNNVNMNALQKKN